MRDNLIDMSSFKDYIKSRDDGNSYRSLSIDNYYTKSGVNKWSQYKKSHIAVMNASKEFKTIYVVAGNGVGKTFMKCATHVYHATGRYPFWWKGIVFKPGVRVAGNKNIYPNVVTLLETQELDTIKASILPLLLGKAYCDSGLARDAGTGFIKREWFSLNKKGDPNIVLDQNGNVRKILVKHVSGTVSEICLKAASQGKRAIVSLSANYATGDEDIPENLKAEIAARVHTRWRDGRVLFTNTEDKNVTTVNEALRRRLEKKQEITTLPTGEVVKVYKTFIISSEDIPHISDDQRAALRGVMSSDEYDARVKGVVNLGRDRVITANFEDHLVRDEKNKIVDFSEHDKRLQFMADLRSRGYVPMFAVDTGTNSTACLLAYVKRLSVIEDIDAYLVDAYNYHAVSSSEKWFSIDDHGKEMTSMLSLNGTMLHAGIIDGSARIDRTGRDRTTFVQEYKKILFNDVQSTYLRNAARFNKSSLENRVKFINELFNKKSIKIMYSKRPGLGGIKRGTWSIQEQLRRWTYKINDRTGARVIEQQGGNVHLLKDCLSPMLIKENLSWLLNRNSNINEYGGSRHGLLGIYESYNDMLAAN